MQNNQIEIFFTTKADGNLAFHVGDDTDKVISNHKELAHKHNYNLDSLVHMKQIHSDIVHIVTDDDNFSNPPECDALITNKKNIPLMVMVADCTPIIFHDEKEGVIAVAHAGRQGAFKNILKNTIDTMQKTFNSNIDDINIEIGSSIGVCCYEVGSEIYEETKELNLEYSIDKKDDTYYLDVGKIIYSQLLDAGVLSENISINKECSCCTEDKYYSYRANPQTGRFAGVIYLT